MAYADLQANGYIDHFFVAPQYARQGVGRLLAHIELAARQNGLHELSADVSLNAQAFFVHFGFELQRRQIPVVRGIALSNAREKLLNLAQIKLPDTTPTDATHELV
jgi:putative acetyltransferase